MNNINFNDGYKELTINNDSNRVIRFNPSDFGMIERYNEARKTISQTVEAIGKDFTLKMNGEPMDDLEETAVAINNVNTVIKEQLNHIFNSDVASAAFGNQSPISTVGGKWLFDRFLDAIGPFMEKEIKAEQKASQERINKYTKQVR